MFCLPHLPTPPYPLQACRPLPVGRAAAPPSRGHDAQLGVQQGNEGGREAGCGRGWGKARSRKQLARPPRQGGVAHAV